MSNRHFISERQYAAVRIKRSTMKPPIAMAAPTQSIKRSERLVPQAFFHENSPALPPAGCSFLRPARLRSGSVGLFFRITAFSDYVSPSKTVPDFHHLLGGLSWRSCCCYLYCKEDSAAGRISLTKARDLMHDISNDPGEPQTGSAKAALSVIGRQPDKYSHSWNRHVGCNTKSAYLLTGDLKWRPSSSHLQDHSF